MNLAILRPDGTSSLSNVEYYRFFVLAMLGSAILFVPFASFYQEMTFIQDHEVEMRDDEANPDGRLEDRQASG